MSSTGQFELPPTPPQGIFDARFNSNKYVELLSDNSISELPIRLSSVIYPLTIQWNVTSSSSHLLVAGKAMNIQGTGSTTLTAPSTQLALRVNPLVKTSLPTEYSLQQNYPNPFNPSTVINYSLPVEGFVSLKVFDVLGREIATLVNEPLNAGVHQIEWNAGNQPSGVYYYRLQAGTFTDTKKLLLTK